MHLLSLASILAFSLPSNSITEVVRVERALCHLWRRRRRGSEEPRRLFASAVAAGVDVIVVSTGPYTVGLVHIIVAMICTSGTSISTSYHPHLHVHIHTHAVQSAACRGRRC